MKHFGKTLAEIIRPKWKKRPFAKVAGISEAQFFRMLDAETWDTASDVYRRTAEALVKEGLIKQTEDLNAAWMGEAADPEAPAKNTSQEKPMMDPLDLVRGLSTLNLEQCDMLQALLTRRMEQLHAHQKNHHAKSARSAS